MFSRAKHFFIYGGSFYNIENQIVQGQLPETGYQLLLSKIAPDAIHNSLARQSQSGCHPRTREPELKKISQWIKDDRHSRRMLWLYGPAGSGKSKIVQTICEQLERDKLLAASIFISGSVHWQSLIPTVVYQLLNSMPDLKCHVIAALESDPKLFDKSLAEQVHRLIIQPLAKIGNNVGGPRLIAIDGLDECVDTKIRFEVIKAIAGGLKLLQYPLRVLICSRPEPDLWDIFATPEVHDITRRIFLDFFSLPYEDIRIYLSEELSKFKVKKARYGFNPHGTWPSEDEILCLTKESSGHFAHAASLIRAVTSPDHDPVEQLKCIINGRFSVEFSQNAESDGLFRTILQSVPSGDIDTALLILGSVMTTRIPLSPSQLSSLLSLRSIDLYRSMTNLYSMMIIPDSITAWPDPIRFCYRSFLNFLADKRRAGEYYVDVTEIHTKLAIRCLCILNEANSLARDYAEDSWAYHCMHANGSKELLSMLSLFDLRSWIKSQVDECWSTTLDGLPFLSDLEKVMQWMQGIESGARLYAQFSFVIDGCIMDVLKSFRSTKTLSLVLCALQFRTLCKKEFLILGINELDYDQCPMLLNIAGNTGVFREFILNPDRSHQYYPSEETHACLALRFWRASIDVLSLWDNGDSVDYQDLDCFVERFLFHLNLSGPPPIIRESLEKDLKWMKQLNVFRRPFQASQMFFKWLELKGIVTLDDTTASKGKLPKYVPFHYQEIYFPVSEAEVYFALRGQTPIGILAGTQAPDIFNVPPVVRAWAYSDGF